MKIKRKKKREGWCGKSSMDMKTATSVSRAVADRRRGCVGVVKGREKCEREVCVLLTS